MRWGHLGIEEIDVDSSRNIQLDLFEVGYRIKTRKTISLTSEMDRRIDKSPMWARDEGDKIPLQNSPYGHMSCPSDDLHDLFQDGDGMDRVYMRAFRIRRIISDAASIGLKSLGISQYVDEKIMLRR